MGGELGSAYRRVELLRRSEQDFATTLMKKYRARPFVIKKQNVSGIALVCDYKISEDVLWLSRGQSELKITRGARPSRKREFECTTVAAGSEGAVIKLPHASSAKLGRRRISHKANSRTALAE